MDARLVDGAVNGAGQVVGAMSAVLRLFQTGSVKTYAASTFLGVVAHPRLLHLEIARIDRTAASLHRHLAAGRRRAAAAPHQQPRRREGRADPQRHAGGVAGDVRWRRWRCGPASTPAARRGEFQFVERLRWIPAFGIEYYLGIDGISLMLIVLTGFLTPIALLSSWESIHKKVKEFSIFMLLLEASMLGVFAALDVFLFYVFWDFVLIPMYFLIGVWGYDRRIYAAVKFILYTMAGSVLMLVAIIGLSWLHQRRPAATASTC